MNHEIVNEYLKEVKKELSGLCSADEFLSSMREYLDDYCDEHPDCTIRDLKDEFGTPEEVAGEFLESKGISNSGKIKKLKNSRRLIAIIAVVLVVVLIAVIAFAELLMLDRSSCLLAEGSYISSLTGEYVFGRMFLLVSVFILQRTGRFTLNVTVLLYLVQYILVIIFFIMVSEKKRKQNLNRQMRCEDQKVSVRKLLQYQRADIMQAMIGQMPVILQYVLAGAFEAGVVGIVLLIKKLINFISGPAAKVFLPEFSRLYHRGDREGLRDSFSAIMRIQMMFAGPLAVVLAGYPEVVLKILAEELIPYTVLFMGCSLIFIIAATLGPCGGLMQMTGNERMDNRCREAAILLMAVIFVLMRKDPLFALYGLGAQTFVESVSKYIFVCRWLKKPPVRFYTYLKWWILPAAAIGVSRFMHWQNSLVMMIAAAGIVFCIQFAAELKNEKGLRQMLQQRRSLYEPEDTDD